MARHNDQAMGDAVRNIVADMLTSTPAHERMDNEEELAKLKNDQAMGDAARHIIADMLMPALGHDRMDAEEELAKLKERVARLEVETERLRALIELVLSERAVGDNAPSSKGS